MIRIEVKGADPTLRELRRWVRAYPRAAAAAVFQMGLDLHRRAQRLVPVNTGRLRSTGYVAPPTNESNPTCEVGYGTDYAIYVHEKEARHLVGESGFLRKPMNAMISRYVASMMNLIEQNAKDGVGVHAVPSDAPVKPTE